MIRTLNVFDLLGARNVVVEHRHAAGRAGVVAETGLGDVDLAGLRNALRMVDDVIIVQTRDIGGSPAVETLDGRCAEVRAPRNAGRRKIDLRIQCRGPDGLHWLPPLA